ncbi:MAG TPA: hypothetical protein PKY82_26305 [Pyrinomonadaceae bacterium]|nr:hypothetical protein [Pyrinomonadaceae bacterium]
MINLTNQTVAIQQPKSPAPDWVQTFTGKKVNPFQPSTNQIDILDIAHHLAMKVRFNGAVKEYYSVAEHSVLISQYLFQLTNNPELALAGLLHDGSEAYLCDIPQPVKHTPEFEFYRRLEKSWDEAIFTFFNLPATHHRFIKRIDLRICDLEAQLLVNPRKEWQFSGLPELKISLHCWEWKEAKREFLKHYFHYHHLREKSLSVTKI